MKEIVVKLGALAKSMAVQRGPLTLFALVLPEDTIAWDLLIAADWINNEGDANSLAYLVNQVQQALTATELLNIAGIIPLDNDQFSNDLSQIESETGWEENNINFFGRHVQKAYIFAAPLANFQMRPSLSSQF